MSTMTHPSWVALHSMAHSFIDLVKAVIHVISLMKVKSLSHVLLFTTPWTVAYQTPPSIEFSRQEYWSGLPFPSPGGLPNPGIEPGSPTLQADTLPSEPPGKYPSEGRQNENHNHRKLIKLITWTTALSNSMKLWARPWRATQDGQVMVESSDKTWSTGEGNGKALQYSCLENPMNSMKRQKDRTLKDELPRLVGVQYAMGRSGEITPERMKRQSQSGNNTQLWMWLVMEVKSDGVKNNIV